MNLYENLHEFMKNLHIESMQQNKEKESESTWKIEKGKMHVEYEISGNVHDEEMQHWVTVIVLNL